MLEAEIAHNLAVVAVVLVELVLMLNGSNGGNGGAGLSYDITGSSQYYAAGGAGGTYVGNGGTGGSSIGGDGCGGSGCSSVDTSATANTGSGGGSNGNLGAGGSSGNGASGIVVVNYSYSGSSNAEHNLTISTGSGAVDINGAVANIGTLSITSTSTSSEASGIISTDTVITKAGSGTLLLSANNTYTGQTNINAGIISITDNNSLGSADGATIVADGASLSISNDITSAENITIKWYWN
jgi:autotransporter-associated beta strand protein